MHFRQDVWQGAITICKTEEEQGLMEGRGCVDQIYILKSKEEKHTRKNTICTINGPGGGLR